MCAMWENQHCRGLPMVTCVALPHVGHMGLHISAGGGDLLPHATLTLGGVTGGLFRTLPRVKFNEFNEFKHRAG